MSHFSLAVIISKEVEIKDLLDAVGLALVPFDENLRPGATIEELKIDITNKIISKFEERKFTYEHFLKNEDQYEPMLAKYYKEQYLTDAEKSPTELYLEYVESIGSQDIDDEGNVISNYNPNTKWDWFDLGGRWKGMLKVDGAAMLLETKDTYYVPGQTYDEDISRIKDVMFEKIEGFDEKGYGITYAILDKGGNWYEQVFTTNTEYVTFCEEFFKKQDQEDWIVIIDCHI
jgi:hypothetical protein